EYLSGGQLDPGPRPIGDVDPVYPPEAKLQEGTVVLRLLISADGRVDDAAVVRAYPPDLFEAAALAAWRAAKFEPGRVLGVAVKSQMTIEVRFTPINRGKISSRSY
ncbi:MAG: energy transducer TonB, partial [Pseudomonadota bacterium]|nr:energy transducer TonB [Pseudomonadota bacterium]